MNSQEKVIDTFLGSNEYPVHWKDEEEKKLHWFYDDLHCPNPISPLYFDCAGWWGEGLTYMYKRFGFPGGKYWIGKKINGYVYSAVVPRTDEQELKWLTPYFNMTFPVYAEKFLGWWKDRYLPEILTNLNYLDNYKYENISIGELMIHVEDTMDICARHLQIHWILNLAQFFSDLLFQSKYQEVIGNIDEDNIGKILVSTDDKNWESLKGLYDLKEFIKQSASLSLLFKKNSCEIAKDINSVKDGSEFIELFKKYQQEFGYKTIYTHEFIYPTWKEDPTPIYSALKTYLETDYNFFDAYKKCSEDQKHAISDLMAKVSDPVKKEELKVSLDLAVKMAPLTPDHHFYIDQGTYARVRLVYVEVGKAFVKMGAIDNHEDIFMLKYEEIRAISANVNAFDSKKLVEERRKEIYEAKKIHPREWFGTITQWSLYEESYKSLWGWPHKYEEESKEKKNTVKQNELNNKKLNGLPASRGVVEGIARFVTSPAEFDQIQNGEILVCKMTSPAWVVSFTKIAGLVTDTGGATSHPAIVAREFGIPCVVGTRKATHIIRSGMKIRVDGNTGTVEILD